MTYHRHSIGAFGQVIEATDEDGKRVAIKLQEKKQESRFNDTVNILKKVQAKNKNNDLNHLAHYITSGEEGSCQLIVFDAYSTDLKKTFDGETGFWMDRRTHDEASFKSIAKQILTAANTLHSLEPKPVAHCDIKPSNIFIKTENGKEKLYLGDFGNFHTFPPKSRVKTDMNVRAPEINYNDWLNVKHLKPLYLNSVHNNYFTVARDEAEFLKQDVFSIGMTLLLLFVTDTDDRFWHLNENTEFNNPQVGQRLGLQLTSCLTGVASCEDLRRDTMKMINGLRFFGVHGIYGPSRELVDLLSRMLDPNLETRITSKQALDHEYFSTKPKDYPQTQYYLRQHIRQHGADEFNLAEYKLGDIERGGIKEHSRLKDRAKFVMKLLRAVESEEEKNDIESEAIEEANRKSF